MLKGDVFILRKAVDIQIHERVIVHLEKGTQLVFLFEKKIPREPFRTSNEQVYGTIRPTIYETIFYCKVVKTDFPDWMSVGFTDKELGV